MKIKIENLRNIRLLEFELPKIGVHIISGENGVGKSTLFSCLSATSDVSQFSKNFLISRTKGKSPINIENYKKAKINFESQKGENTYSFGGSRWRGQNKAVPLKEISPYSETILIEASESRLFRQKEFIDLDAISPAPQEVIAGMSRILNTQQFDNLKLCKAGSQKGVKSKTYRDKIAFLQEIDGVDRYSDSSFSLGEAMLLNLLFEIHQIPDNSLVLIDEIELSLHAKVQTRLFKYLAEKAKEKNLTVLISTHSITLINLAKKIIHLERKTDDGLIEVNYKASPANAIRGLADYYLPDIVFFTEDDMGKIILEQQIKYYFKHFSKTHPPQYRIVPVAGWIQVLQFMDNVDSYLLPPFVKKYAFLDEDVILALKKTNTSDSIHNIYKKWEKQTRFLPITPEIGIMEVLRKKKATLSQQFQAAFPQIGINLEQIQLDYEKHFPTRSSKKSEEAKVAFNHYSEKISNSACISKSETVEKFVSIWLNEYILVVENKNNLRKVLGAIFR